MDYSSVSEVVELVSEPELVLELVSEPELVEELGEELVGVDAAAVSSRSVFTEVLLTLPVWKLTVNRAKVCPSMVKVTVEEVLRLLTS